MKLSQTQINQAMEHLPENIQNAVKNYDWVNLVTTIGKKFRLGIDDIDIIHQKTLLVVIGELPAAQYEESLMQEMGINRELADKIVEFTNEHVFNKLQQLAFSKPHHTEKEDDSDDDDYLLHNLEHSTNYEGHTPEIKESLEKNKIVEEDIIDLDQTAFDLQYTKNGIIPGAVEPINKEVNTHQEEILTKTPPEYRETIHDKDLLGKTKHRTDTSVLDTQQIKTEHNFDVDVDEVLKPFAKKPLTKKQSLEQEIMNIGILSKGDSTTHESEEKGSVLDTVNTEETIEL